MGIWKIYSKGCLSVGIWTQRHLVYKINFGTDDEKANLDRNQLDETHGIETVTVPDERDETTEKQDKN